VTPLAIGALLSVAAMVWVIAPIFGEEHDDAAHGRPATAAADAAAEEAIRKWREPKE
jgi:hypothetical protein